jgi:methylenetetrahydrofolate--tRNA-(uracil-5-)-methyltransferase
MGLIAGRLAAADRLGTSLALPPPATAHGALLNHITGGHIETTDHTTASFQPMNVNFGLFPPVAAPLSGDGKRLKGTAKQVARKMAYTSRAMSEFRDWLVRYPAATEAAE